jgi:hypothetical protein
MIKKNLYAHTFHLVADFSRESRTFCMNNQTWYFFFYSSSPFRIIPFNYGGMLSQKRKKEKKTSYKKYNDQHVCNMLP